MVAERLRYHRGMESCLLCNGSAPVLGVLCVDCAGSLASADRLCPEQIVCLVDDDAGAACIDRWGRVHPLAERTVLGRQVPDGISVAEAGISREHAAIERTAKGLWYIADLGSTNGTFVNGERIDKRLRLRSADEIHLADVALFFVIPPGGLPDDLPIVVGATLRPDKGVPAFAALGDIGKVNDDDDDDEDTWSGLPKAAVAMHEPSGGGGGVMILKDTTVPLSAAQYELMRILVDRMTSDAALPDIIRGFVRSSELLGSLPWDTPYPDENHVKQLVRRVRRAFAKVEVKDPIESRHRFGYRVNFVPST